MEQTGQQRLAIMYSGETPQEMPATYATYRAMRKHPTIAIIRALTIAPTVANEWSTKAREDATDEMVIFVEGCFFPVRSQLMEQALLGGGDFGWQPWEKILDIRNGKMTLVKLKPLLHDITTILIEKKTGAFAGFKQNQFELPLENSFLIPWRVEGTYWYGSSLLENCRTAYNDWVVCNVGAAKYDRKVAGAHFVVEYPIGETITDGGTTDNYDIAVTILRALESDQAGVLIPREVDQHVEKLNEAKSGWSITILADASPKQITFIPRQEYLDVLMVRGYLWPERGILEGKFGTKAEAGEHVGLALKNSELMDRHVTRHVNWHLVDQLLALNFGESARGAVQLVSAPLVDEKLEFLRTVLEKYLADPAGFADMMNRLDIEALLDKLEVPRNLDVKEPKIEEEIVKAVHRMVRGDD